MKEFLRKAMEYSQSFATNSVVKVVNCKVTVGIIICNFCFLLNGIEQLVSYMS